MLWAMRHFQANSGWVKMTASCVYHLQLRAQLTEKLASITDSPLTRKPLEQPGIEQLQACTR